ACQGPAVLIVWIRHYRKTSRCMHRFGLLTVAISLLLTAVAPPGLTEQSSPRYRQLREDAQKLIQAGKLKQALSLDLKAAELKPGEPAVHESLSTVYAQLGNNSKALEEARRVVELRPRGELAHYNLALSLQAMGRRSEALAEYRKAISLKNSGPEAPIGEAQCLIALGRIVEGIRGLESLSKQFPQRKDVWLNLAHAYLSYQDQHGALLAAEAA